jgi:hypothetical protein
MKGAVPSKLTVKEWSTGKQTTGAPLAAEDEEALEADMNASANMSTACCNRNEVITV